jgi:uncharacterized membrane protein YfbV (UPF0208 family)
MEVRFLALCVMFVVRSASAMGKTYFQLISPIYSIPWAMKKSILQLVSPLFGYYGLLPSRLVQAVTSLTYIREVPSSTTLTENCYGIIHYLQENTEVLPKIMPRPLPATHFPVHSD